MRQYIAIFEEKIDYREPEFSKPGVTDEKSNEDGGQETKSEESK